MTPSSPSIGVSFDEGLSGLFASQSIPKGKIIITVPLNLTISAAQSEYLDDEDDYDKETCHLLHNVHSSIIKNDTIQTPYERYLTSRTHHHIPSNWSPQAKKMLKQLDSPATAPLFGFEFHDVKDRIQTCGGFDENMATDSKFADAASLTYTRSEGSVGIALVPFMDIINHANGKQAAHSLPGFLARATFTSVAYNGLFEKAMHIHEPCIP